MTISLALSACATPANRRALYFPARPKGPWHDYEKRRLAEAQTGVSVASMTTTTTTSATPMPKSGPPTPMPKSAPPAPSETAMPAGAASPDAAPPAPPAPASPAIEVAPQ